MYSIQSDMDLRTRATLLSESADRDGTGGAAIGPGSALTRPGDPVGITKVGYPGQGVTRLMRVMQTNACSLSCGYCPTFCGGKVRRTYLSPEEGRAGRVHGDRRRNRAAARSSPARIPLGRNSTTAMRSSPIQKYQYGGLM